MARPSSAYQPLAANVQYGSDDFNNRFGERLLASGDTATNLMLNGGDVSTGGSLIPTAPYARTTAQEAADWPHVARWGVVANASLSGDGTTVQGTDDTAALNAALASGQPLRWPSTDMRVTDALLIQRVGQRIRNLNRDSGRLLVGPDFRMAARGVVDVQCATGAADSGIILDDLSIAFAQPDTATRSALVAYPAGIYVNSTARVQLRRPRVIGGNVGLSWQGNCGGHIVTNPRDGLLRDQRAD